MVQFMLFAPDVHAHVPQSPQANKGGVNGVRDKEFHIFFLNRADLQVCREPSNCLAYGVIIGSDPVDLADERNPSPGHLSQWDKVRLRSLVNEASLKLHPVYPNRSIHELYWFFLLDRH